MRLCHVSAAVVLHDISALLGYYLQKEFCCLQATMIQLFSSLNVKLRNVAMVCLWNSQQSTEDPTE